MKNGKMEARSITIDNYDYNDRVEDVVVIEPSIDR